MLWSNILKSMAEFMHDFQTGKITFLKSFPFQTDPSQAPSWREFFLTLLTPSVLVIMLVKAYRGCNIGNGVLCSQ